MTIKYALASFFKQILPWKKKLLLAINKADKIHFAFEIPIPPEDIHQLLIQQFLTGPILKSLLNHNNFFQYCTQLKKIDSLVKAVFPMI